MFSCDENSHGGALLLGLVIGAVAGAAVALLLAPSPGSETRDRLQESAHNVQENLKKRLAERRSRQSNGLVPAE